MVLVKEVKGLLCSTCATGALGDVPSRGDLLMQLRFVHAQMNEHHLLFAEGWHHGKEKI